jgi:nicotinate-nucleotide pyrophosphorylase (carboxylating)
VTRGGTEGGLLGRFDAKEPGGPALDELLERVLREDHAYDDRSTLPLPGADAAQRADVLAREDGVLAGTGVFRRTLELLAGGAAIAVDGLTDGAAFRAGDVVLRVTAPGRVLLGGERTALNFLQRLSGIATVTRRCVDAAGPGLAVCDTRKTTPGLRALEKWAVIVGGGRSHRWSLGDMVMLKENHLAMAGGVAAAVAAIRADPASAALPLTVEVTTRAEAREAAAAGADRLLLDNMAPDEMAIVVRELSDAAGARPELEASGGLRVDDLPAVAASGVDLVSLGSLTHSVRAIDFSLLVRPAGE